MRIEHVCHPLGDTGNADVPGDVPRQLVFRNAEIAECARQNPSVVIRGEQEGRCACRIHLMHWRNVTLAEQLIRRAGCV
jgi:hypothetical protein